MKVLIISNLYPSKKHPSFGIFIQNHIELFNKENIKYLLIANQIKKRGIFLVPIKYFILVIKTVYFSLVSSFDLIHAHYIFPTGFIALIPKYLRKKKLVITVHGGDIDNMPNRNILLRKLTNFTLDKTDKIICVSENIVGKINAKFEIPCQKMHVINMGVDTKLFTPIPKNKARHHLGLTSDKRIILFVGNLIKSKGINYLLEAISLLKNEKLICCIIGSGTEEDNLRNMCKRLNISNRVQFIGSKPHSTFPSWFCASDIFVLPSLKEAFGLVLLESFACGIPVITSNVGGIPEFVRDDYNGFLVWPKDPKAIADKINLLFNNQTIYQRLSENTRGTALQHAIRIKIKKIKEVYDEVIVF